MGNYDENGKDDEPTTNLANAITKLDRRIMRLELTHVSDMKAIGERISGDLGRLSDRVTSWHDRMNGLMRDYGHWDARFEEFVEKWDERMRKLEDDLIERKRLIIANRKWFATLLTIVTILSGIIGALLEHR